MSARLRGLGLKISRAISGWMWIIGMLAGALALVAMLMLNVNIAADEAGWKIAHGDKKEEPLFDESWPKYRWKIEPKANAKLLGTRAMIDEVNDINAGFYRVFEIQSDAKGELSLPVRWERPAGESMRIKEAMITHPMGDRLRTDREGIRVTGLEPSQSYRVGVAMWTFLSYQGESENQKHVNRGSAGLVDCLDACLLAISEPTRASPAASGPEARPAAAWESWVPRSMGSAVAAAVAVMLLVAISASVKRLIATAMVGLGAGRWVALRASSSQ